MTDGRSFAQAMPDWLPDDVRNYVQHTEMGRPIRELARSQACHASTIMRQIRKVEARRDDPLVDRAIRCLSEDELTQPQASTLNVLHALRRLSVPNAMLAIAIGMDQGVILDSTSGDDVDHATNLPAATAMTLALKGWIATTQTEGRVLRYRITPAGRVALRELTASSENQAREMAEAAATFEHARPKLSGAPRPSVARSAHVESPVVALSRRREKDGTLFLTRAMVRAAERLREDYEIAEIGREKAQGTDWHAVLSMIEDTRQPVTAGEGASPAAVQVVNALVFLGPGLAEVALRCCCWLEGLEVTEKQMNWAARSGKVVLRIALLRLVLHYDQTGQLGPKIG